MLKKLLEDKKCFKLICGAGNENLEEVKRLVALYSKAGCRYFDFSANPKVLEAAQSGLDFSFSKEEQKDFTFCVSVGGKGDAHFNKAKINHILCKKCMKCVKICPQNAIEDTCKIIENKCIGCLRCKNVCENNAIEICRSEKSFEKQLEAVFDLKNPLLKSVELHVSGKDGEEAFSKWNYLNKNFDGMLSVCLGRQNLSNEEILERLNRFLEGKPPYSVIVQADGSPMSGGENDYKTTLQAVAMAELVQSADLPVFLIVSGGVNSKTAELANICKVDINGIAVGSFARKIVKDYINSDNFWENKAVFNEALKKAAGLVKTLDEIKKF